MNAKNACLAATLCLDSEHAAVIALDRKHAKGYVPHERVLALQMAVRDGLRYDPYRIDLSAPGLNASTALAQGFSCCMPKTLVLAAGVLARLGFADVRNHLSTERLRQSMPTNVFAWHGYTVLWLVGA